MVEKIDAAVLIILRERNRILEALVGQNEVRNNLKSTQKENIFMRFPGEFKFPGGRVEEGETAKEAAIREAIEEFPGIKLTSTQALLLHKYTEKRVHSGNREYSMNVFVLPQDIQSIGINTINQNLEEKRKRFLQALLDKNYYDLSFHDKEKLSPEVHKVSWKPLPEIISTVSKQGFVNDWQKSEFEKYGKSWTDREPIYKSAEILTELLKHNNLTNLRAFYHQHCNHQ